MFFQHKISTAQAAQSLANTSAVIKRKAEAGITATVYFSLVIVCKVECFLVVASCTLGFGVQRGLELHSINDSLESGGVGVHDYLEQDRVQDHYALYSLSWLLFKLTGSRCFRTF